jgi:hypothetical protein
LDEGQEAAQQVVEDDELGLIIWCKAEWEVRRVDVVKKSAIGAQMDYSKKKTVTDSDHGEGNVRVRIRSFRWHTGDFIIMHDVIMHNSLWQVGNKWDARCITLDVLALFIVRHI